MSHQETLPVATLEPAPGRMWPSILGAVGNAGATVIHPPECCFIEVHAQETTQRNINAASAAGLRAVQAICSVTPQTLSRHPGWHQAGR